MVLCFKGEPVFKPHRGDRTKPGAVSVPGYEPKAIKKLNSGRRREGVFFRLDFDVPLLRSPRRSSVLKSTIVVSLGTA